MYFLDEKSIRMRNNNKVCPMQWSCNLHHPNSLLKTQAGNLMSEKPNRQEPVLSRCFMPQTHVTESTLNLTGTEKGLFINVPFTDGFKQF